VSNDFFILALININVILILFLIFLIIRNVVKLVFERRKGVLGARLRTKLVAAFVSLSLIPTALLFFVSINFLSYSIENWFSLKIGDALEQTIDLVRIHYQQTENQGRFYAVQLASDITQNQLYDQDREDFLINLARLKQKNFHIDYLQVSFDNWGKNIIFHNPDFPDFPEDLVTAKIRENLYEGKESVVVRPIAAGDLVNVFAPIRSALGPQEVIGYVLIASVVPREIVDKIAIVSNTSAAYNQLHLFKNPIKLNYIITLSIVTLLIVFFATWFGLFLARGITEPIQDLAEATHKIAGGDLNYQIDIVSEDEIGVLVDSFNQMTKDLKKTNENLQQANAGLEERRKYIEAVFLHISAGIISVDQNGIVAAMNRAAEMMLDIQKEDVLNRPSSDLLTAENMSIINELMDEVNASGHDVVEKQIELLIRNRPLTVLAAITVIREDNGQNLGMVMVFEDLTQLQKAERAAAWREVARRMAHEIKNPLTPVQLSAQRLQKRYSEKLGDDGQVFQECTDTIITQVEVLKNLVNEFSRYARMPVTTLALNDLNETVNDPVLLFQDAHKEITFHFMPEGNIPLLYLDAEQIQRVIINLLDNSIAAMIKAEGQIDITTRYDQIKRKAQIIIADNGCGVPPAHTMKIFEPYYSTKKSGTGLGLAIVNSIIADHNGVVMVRANEPSGTVVLIELPVPDMLSEHEKDRGEQVSEGDTKDNIS
ncbi:MAG: HAMP domain-containing protein, partial [Syntrophobacterales bacterium]|nr:HAMP domain-containing protein [Syntrophobacterales bacterium]